LACAGLPIKPETLAELVKKPNIPEVVEGLTGTIFYKPLLNAMDSYNKTHTISDLENSLDKAYYNYMATLPVPKMNATALFINFVQREIDFTNLRTLFRLKRAGLEYDKIMDYMIPGGSKLKTDDLRKMAQAPSFDEFVNMLKEYPYWADLAEAVENYRETKSLNAVEIALYKGLMGYANKISHLYPLSVTPILGYAINKNVEINNLRTIARGKEMHLSDETIKSQLVI
jgi:V/A-type H+-transporting ATPase subunit C